MIRELKVGDRVRVTMRNRMAGYEPGDEGTLLHATRSAGGRYFYLVAMDGGEPDSTGVIFTEGEIVPDV
jgi:hypothetical protein